MHGMECTNVHNNTAMAKIIIIKNGPVCMDVRVCVHENVHCISGAV